MSSESSYDVRSSKQYDRTLQKFLAKHPELRDRVRSITLALKNDPFAPSLRLHALSGNRAGFWAVRITYSYRITLILDREQLLITLDNIGSHQDVYVGGDDD